MVGHVGRLGPRSPSRSGGGLARNLLLAKSRGGLLRVACGERHSFWLASFTVVVGLFAAFEFVFALRANSLMLLADAFHQSFDCVALGCSLWAMVGARRAPTASYTFGYSRHEVLVTFANATLLLFIGAFLAVEALHRLCSGEAAVVTASRALVGVGIGGLALNLIGVVVFYRFVRSFRIRHLPNASGVGSTALRTGDDGGGGGGSSSGASDGGDAVLMSPKLYDVEAAKNGTPSKRSGLPGNPLLDLHKDVSEIMGAEGDASRTFPWRLVLRTCRDGVRGSLHACCASVVRCIGSIGTASGAGQLPLQITSGDAPRVGKESRAFGGGGRPAYVRTRVGAAGGSSGRERIVWMHIGADVASSVVVLIGSALVHSFALHYADVVCALAVVALLLWSTFPLATQTCAILLQSTPPSLRVRVDRCARQISAVDGVLETSEERCVNRESCSPSLFLVMFTLSLLARPPSLSFSSSSSLSLCNTRRWWSLSPRVHVASLVVRARRDADTQVVLRQIRAILEPHFAQVTLQVQKDVEFDDVMRGSPFRASALFNMAPGCVGCADDSCGTKHGGPKARTVAHPMLARLSRGGGNGMKRRVSSKVDAAESRTRSPLGGGAAISEAV